VSGGFFFELKRRNVIRAAILYIGAVWALAQGISQLGPSVGAPEWTTRWFLVAAAIGFPFWIAFAWFYEFTPEGLKRESQIDPADSVTAHTGKKLDRWIFAIMGIAIVLLLTDRFVLHHGVNADADVTVSEKSIAVLPFVNMSEEKSNEYFSDGISEDLLNLLAKIPELQVTARTSAFSFKGKDAAQRDIAHQLHVAHLLVGSVQKIGNVVRISAQLVDAASDTQRWSQTWDRKLDDVFAIQDEIAATVVEQLRIKLLGAAPTAKPIDPQAYALILQAQELLNHVNPKNMEQSIELNRRALAIAPNESRAWTGLARAYMNQTLLGALRPQQGAELGRQAANKALQADPTNAAAYAVLGRIASDVDFDLAAAARYFQHALDIEPGNLGAINGSAILLTAMGRVDEAISLDEYRVAHDPANPVAHHNLGVTRYMARRWDAAIDAERTALRLSPDFTGAHGSIGFSLLVGKADAEGALKEFEAETDEANRLCDLPFALHALGRTQQADAALQVCIDRFGAEQPGNMPTIYAYRGQADAAFEWLEKTAAAHDSLISFIVAEPLLDRLRDDPRWLPFLRKVGYAPEQLAKIEFKVTLPDSGGGARATVP
jgi:TolB-like protein/Tfp pilus assembly protein PilF